MRWLLFVLILVMIGLAFWLPRRARQAGADLRRRIDERNRDAGVAG